MTHLIEVGTPILQANSGHAYLGPRLMMDLAMAEAVLPKNEAAISLFEQAGRAKDEEAAQKARGYVTSMKAKGMVP
jgi:hypothetical protein